MPLTRRMYVMLNWEASSRKGYPDAHMGPEWEHEIPEPLRRGYVYPK